MKVTISNKRNTPKVKAIWNSASKVLIVPITRTVGEFEQSCLFFYTEEKEVKISTMSFSQELILRKDMPEMDFITEDQEITITL